MTMQVANMQEAREAIKGLSKRQLEELADAVARELQACTLCGTEGARSYVVQATGFKVSMLFCKPCIEKNRLPEARAVTSET